MKHFDGTSGGKRRRVVEVVTMQARSRWHLPQAPRLGHRRGTIVLAFGTAVVLNAPAIAAKAAPPTAPPVTPVVAVPAIKPPPLAFHLATLKNGLKVITLEDHHAPVVTLQIWYRVGSKDETRGRYGFAHLFEHLMFKGSKNVPSEGHARYIEQAGGEYNADTSFDRTRFYETVQSNVLDRALFLEADRMSSLVVDQKNLDSERHVVEEELRSDVTNAAYGGVQNTIQSMVYPAGHPYAHAPIGSIADLDAATLPEVQAFHETYYKPDNATLVLVGDFQTSEAMAEIQKYFGPILPRGKPFPRQAIPMTPSPTELAVSLPDPLAALPLVTVAFPIPGAASADVPVLRVIATIIGGGLSSRISISLVSRMGLSSEASARMNELRFGGLFTVSADVLPGVERQDVTNALNAEIEHLRYRPVSEKDLAKAKTKALTESILGSLETVEVADRLGNTDILFGAPDEVNRSYGKVAAVTAADVQRVVIRYLLPEMGNVLYSVPKTAQKGDSH